MSFGWGPGPPCNKDHTEGDDQDMTPEQPVPAAVQKQSVNVAAIISLACGLLALLVLPILLGPVAVVSGIVGTTIASRTQGPGGRMSAAGIVLGGLATLIVVGSLGAL